MRKLLIILGYLLCVTVTNAQLSWQTFPAPSRFRDSIEAIKAMRLLPGACAGCVIKGDASGNFYWSAGGAGTTGATGATGATGSTGATGATGATGSTGATGAAGATGATGATGSTGATGATGATGSTGATGATGSTGATGATGATGSVSDTTVFWHTLGNTGADSAGMFMGTRNADPVNIRTNNILRHGITSNGLQTFTLPNTTETGETHTANSLTTGIGSLFTSSSLTTGKLISAVSTSTGADNFFLISANSSGANANASRIATGIYSNVVNTGTGAINKACYLYAAGGAFNYGLVVGSGYVGIGIEQPTTNLHVSFSDATSASPVIITNTNTSTTASFAGITMNAQNSTVIGKIGAYPASSSVAGLSLGSISNHKVTFFTNSTPAVYIDNSQRMGVGVSSPTSTLHTTSFAAGYVAKTANYTLTSSEYLVNCTANSFTITLPTAVGVTGRQYIIKNTGTATTITIATTSSQTIDGLTASTYNVVNLTALRVISDGANWITW
jgi:hypothetical protein